MPIWGFGVPTTPGDCSTATTTAPGPTLVVHDGDVVSLTVDNALPAGHTVTPEIAGVTFTPGAADAPSGAAVTRTFTATAGTYLYTSAGDAGRQQAMGLYGMLVVRPATPNQAYGSAETAYDVEATLLLSVLNPDFNTTAGGGDLLAYHATSWLINGRSYPDTTPIPATAGQRVLLRYANAGVAAPGPGVPSASAAGPVEPNIGLVNAPALWDRGFRGQGVVIASMDTGVDNTHPDLSSTWRGSGNSWFDPNGQHTTPTDVSGHGTQTMGVMVGRSAGGSAIGMAPDARCIAVKIFNDRGVTTTTMIHRGFQWLLDPDGNSATADAPDIVNNSWTLSTAGCVLDFQQDLQSLRAAGILPVFAAGNSGPSAGTVASPANNPEALAVGATDNADGLYPYSGRGPSPCTGQTSPCLVAPGTSIRTSDLYAGYVSDNGTSVAAPEVSGAAALLLSAQPSLTPDQQSTALTAAAVDLGPAGPDNDTGSGRLDAFAAYQRLVTTPDFSLTATPGTATISIGAAATFDVTSAVVNGFAGDVALTVTGLPDQATGTFDPTAIVGGSGTSRLTVSTTSQVMPGSYPLTVAGTDGSLTRTTAITLIVQGPPDFAVQVSPATRSVPAGGTATYQVAVSSINGFVGDETLTVSELPAAVGMASVAPAVISTVGSAVLTVSTVAAALLGDYQLQVTGTSGAISHTVTATLTVTAPPDFAATAGPATRSVAAGSAGTFTVTVTPANGFSGR